MSPFAEAFERPRISTAGRPLESQSRDSCADHRSLQCELSTLKLAFQFGFYLFCLERSALQNLARHRQLFVRKKRCTLGLELAIVTSELWLFCWCKAAYNERHFFFGVLYA